MRATTDLWVLDTGRNRRRTRTPLGSPAQPKSGKFQRLLRSFKRWIGRSQGRSELIALVSHCLREFARLEWLGHTLDLQSDYRYASLMASHFQPKLGLSEPSPSSQQIVAPMSDSEPKSSMAQLPQNYHYQARSQIKATHSDRLPNVHPQFRVLSNKSPIRRP